MLKWNAAGAVGGEIRYQAAIEPQRECYREKEFYIPSNNKNGFSRLKLYICTYICAYI